MKKILLILFMVIYSFALEQKFVGPEVAFKSSATKTANSVILKLELYEKMYLYDEKIKVFIVRKNPELVEQDIYDHCREFLTNYKRPKSVEFLEELPKTNVGKVLRKELRKLIINV